MPRPKAPPAWGMTWDPASSAGIPEHEVQDMDSKMRVYERFRTSVLGLKAEFTISILTFRLFLAYILHSGYSGVSVYASKIRKACLDRGLLADTDAFAPQRLQDMPSEPSEP